MFRSLFLSAALLWPLAATAELVAASSIYVVDGDTIDVQGDRFRLVGYVLSDNHLGRCRQPPWPVGLDGRRACPSGGQPHRPD